MTALIFITRFTLRSVLMVLAAATVHFAPREDALPSVGCAFLAVIAWTILDLWEKAEHDR